jgi:hypothetical protein
MSRNLIYDTALSAVLHTNYAIVNQLANFLMPQFLHL